jgi:hypothetical protein
MRKDVPVRVSKSAGPTRVVPVVEEAQKPGLTQEEIESFAEMLTSDVKSLLSNKTPMDEFIEKLNFQYDPAVPAERQRYYLEKAVIASLREKEWPTNVSKDIAARQMNYIWSKISGEPLYNEPMRVSNTYKVKKPKAEHVHSAECSHE